MSEENRGKVDHEDLEEHECNVGGCLAKLIVKEYTNMSCWSNQKHPIIVSKKCLKCTNTLSCQLSKDHLDSGVCADLEKILQSYKLHLICAVLVDSNYGSPTVLECHIVRSEDIAVNKSLNNSKHIIVFDDEVNYQ